MSGNIEPLGLAETIGVIGFIAYVANYLMLTFRIIPPAGIAYFCVNVCAASMVLTGLSASFNMASALIQGFWIVISLVGIALRLRERRRIGQAAGQSDLLRPMRPAAQEPRPKPLPQMAA
ncbi:MAG: CBU_0592 family membrane protein [Paracoccaceae bacterium]